MSGHLMVEIVKADNLLKKDWLFASDPYVVASFSSGSNQTEFQTEHKSSTLNPVYARKFQFKAVDQCDKLTFTLYDHDLMGPHKYMGEAFIWVGSQTQSAKLGYVAQEENEDEEGGEEDPEKVYEKKRIQKLERLCQPGIFEHSPAGVDHDGLTIPILDKDNDWGDAGTITIKWVYSYSSFGGLFAAKLDEIAMAERKTEEALPEFDFDVLKGNIDRIEKRIQELLAPIVYIGDVLNWQNPAESCVWFLIIVYLLRYGLVLSFIPFAAALAMVKNWYTWWRWGPAGPPVMKWEMPVDPNRRTDDGDTIENDVDDDGFILTKLKKLGAKAQKVTGVVVKELDEVHDVLMWRKPTESAIATAALLGLSLVLAIPHLFTLIGMVIMPIWPYAANIGILYMFTLFPLYKQFPYVEKYYQIGALIELLTFSVVHTAQGLPARIAYNRSFSKGQRHLRRHVSPELLELIDRLDSAHLDPIAGARDILLILRTKLFHADARSKNTIARRTKEGLPVVQKHEQLLVYNVMRRQFGCPVEFFVERECDTEAAVPVWRLRRNLDKTQEEAFTGALAIAMSDAIKAELVFRQAGDGTAERSVTRDKTGREVLDGPALWFSEATAKELHQARMRMIGLEISRAKEHQKRERVRKYGDKIPKRPRLTVNVLNCRGLTSKEKGKRVTSRVTYARVILGNHSVVTDKKKHSTAPQFRAQCKFGFDADGSDAFDPRATPFLKVELHEEGRKGAFGQLEIDIRKLPRRTETKERYYNLRRRGNEVVGQMSLSLFAEAFGVECIKFDREVASALGSDRVLQRMYWQAVRGDTQRSQKPGEALSLGRTTTLPAPCDEVVAHDHVGVPDLQQLNPDGSAAGTEEPPAPEVDTSANLMRSMVSANEDSLSSSMVGSGDFRLGGGPSSPQTRGVTGQMSGDQLREEITMLKRMIEDTKALVEDDERRIQELAAPQDTLVRGDDQTPGSDTSEEIVPPRQDKPEVPREVAVPGPVPEMIVTEPPEAAAPVAAAAAPPPAAAPPVGSRSGTQVSAVPPLGSRSGTQASATPPATGRRVSVAEEVGQQAEVVASAPASRRGSAHTRPEGGSTAGAAEEPQPRQNTSPADSRRPSVLKAGTPLRADLPPTGRSPSQHPLLASGSAAGSRRSSTVRAPMYDTRISRDVHRELDRVMRQSVCETGGATPPLPDASPHHTPPPTSNAGREGAGLDTGVTSLFYCDGCSTTDVPQYITVARWTCTDTDNYDLCDQCYRHGCEKQLLNPTHFRRVPLRADEQQIQGPVGSEIVAARKCLHEARLKGDGAAEATWAKTIRRMSTRDTTPPSFDMLEKLSAAEIHATKRSYGGIPDPLSDGRSAEAYASRAGSVWQDSASSHPLALPPGYVSAGHHGR